MKTHLHVWCDSPMPTFQKLPLFFPFSSCGYFQLPHHHRIMRIISIASASPLPPVFKLAFVVSCRFASSSVLSPTALARARGTVETLF